MADDGTSGAGAPGSASDSGDAPERVNDDASDGANEDASSRTNADPLDSANEDASGGASGDATAGPDDSGSGGPYGDVDAPSGPEDLRARLAVRTAENRRLHRALARADRSRYRRTAAGMALLGILALAGAAVLPAERSVLLALAGTGLFAAVLTWTLTPERFLPASVGERVHAAHAANQDALCAELGLQDERVYVPTSSAPATLFVPQCPDFELPDDLDHLLVVTEEPTARGIALETTGSRLYEAFRRSLAGDPATDAGPLAAQLADAVVETFELADGASVARDREGAAVAVRVEEPAFGDLDAVDHPIVSVVATGLAAELDRPVTASVAAGESTDAVLEFRLLDG